MRDSKRDTDVSNSLLDSVGEGGVGAPSQLMEHLQAWVGSSHRSLQKEKAGRGIKRLA